MGNWVGDALDLLEEGLLVVDDEGRVAFCNQAARHAFGVPQVGMLLDGAFGAGGKEAWARILERARAERSYRTVADGPNGRPVRVSVHARPGGGFVLSLREVQEQVQEEPLLRAFAKVLGRHGVGLWRIHVPTGELWWSDACYELLGIPPGPISTAQYLEKLAPEVQGMIGEHMQRELTGAGAYEPLFPVELPEGTRHLHDRAEVLTRDEAGGPLDVVGATLDRTREIELEERLADVEGSRETIRLAGAVAHDLNNAMTVILGNAELLGGDPGDADLADCLESIRTAAAHAGALSSRIVDFVRPSPFRLEPMDLGPFLDESLPFLRSLVPENVRLVCERVDSGAVLRGDRHRIEQALYNLVLNAGQATAPGGRIGIELCVERDDVVLRVRDDGRGMSNDELERIFSPFYSTRVAGAGLGLCSVRQVMEQHDGEVSVRSTPGEGSCFELRFPRCAEAAARREATGKEDEPTDLGIWVVEDEKMVRLVIEKLLVGAGFAVRTFAHVAELDAAIAEAPDGLGGPDVVLTDVILPGTSGPEVEARIRARWPDVRVLFMSGYTEDVLTSHAVATTDEAAVLHKPFSRETLLTAIGEAVR